MTQPDLSLFERKLQERRAREEAKRREHPAFADLVPETEYQKSEGDLDLDRAIEKIDIVEAYTRWCGKSQVKVLGGQRESIKISCPDPAHPDKNPSAWINLDKQTWFCGGCQRGGDIYDIAAWKFGYPVPGYKTGVEFGKLRRDMASDFGYTFVPVPGATRPLVVPPHDPTPEVTEDDPPQGELEAADAEITEIHEDADVDILYPKLNWRSIVAPDSFLDAWMKQTTIDDVPEEYHFWHGMIALGLAAGRNVRLYDSHPVLGNLFVCVLGPTGSGKSKSRHYLDVLLSNALPYDSGVISPPGTKQIGSPASAEVLISHFAKPVYDDPTNPKKLTANGAVRGLVDFNELSALMGRTARQGSVLKPALMEFYDGRAKVTTSSVTSGMKEAYDPFCSVITTTQPRVLRRLVTMEDADSGFLNRWVFAAGPAKERYAIGGVQVDITPATDKMREIAGWTALPRMIQWEPDAIEAVQKFFEVQLWKDREADQVGILTRIDLLFKKLCLLFAINQMQDTISVEIVNRVQDMYEYLMSCYSIPSGIVGNSLADEIRESVLKVTSKAKEGLSISHINRSLKRRKYPMDLLVKVVDLMVQLGELEMLTTKSGNVGRPTVRYRVAN